MRYFFLLLFFGFVSFSFGQHQDKVDFVRADVYIEPVPLNKEVKGRVVYRFDVLQNVDSVFLDAKDMRFEKVELNGKQVDYITTDKTISIRKKLKKDTSHKLTIAYVAKPRQTVYFLGWGDKIEGNEQVWTQGQGKYTSHWLPSFDDMNEKVEFDLAVQANHPYEVIANGKLVSVSKGDNGRPVWLFDMENPMSSYLLAFAIGHYSKQELRSSRGVPIVNYFYPKDSARVGPTYRHTQRIFDFLENEIGVSYPWQDYKQIPVRDFLYAGMENTGATIFSDGYVIDATAFVDKNYINVNAHELAHQWFGNLVTEKNGSHHWLQEGFATYYAYLAEKEIFGDDHFYWKLFDTAKELREMSEGGKGQALVDPKASSATFYEKGAWALVMLRELVGDRPFKKGVSDYLNAHRFKNVTIDDFLKEMEQASTMSLEGFRVKWLESSEFPWDEAKTYLMNKNEALSAFLGSGHELKDLEKELRAERPVQYKVALVDELAQEILEQDRFAPLFGHPQLKVRQKAIQLVNQISDVHKESAEKLLGDSSYITRELALFKLWSSFPESRKVYLDATKEVVGLPNKNVRLLWLFLAVATEGYESENTRKYFSELIAYTSPEYGWEVRIGAFQYLREIGFTDEGLANLINATNHHSWQFKKYARGLIGQLLEDQEYKTRIEKLEGKLNQEETRYISTKLN